MRELIVDGCVVFGSMLRPDSLQSKVTRRSMFRSQIDINIWKTLVNNNPTPRLGEVR